LRGVPDAWRRRCCRLLLPERIGGRLLLLKLLLLKLLRRKLRHDRGRLLAGDACSFRCQPTTLLGACGAEARPLLGLCVGCL
jgi:hypothetical protein